MSRRSKVVLIILIVLVVLIFSSFLNETKANDDNLSKWEDEIANPNNELDPLNENTGKSVFILNVANKIELIINKVFSFLIGFIEGIVDSIFMILI